MNIVSQALGSNWSPLWHRLMAKWEKMPLVVTLISQLYLKNFFLELVILQSYLKTCITKLIRPYSSINPKYIVLCPI